MFSSDYNESKLCFPLFVQKMLVWNCPDYINVELEDDILIIYVYLMLL